MRTTKPAPRWNALALPMLLSFAGCATVSPQQPPVTGPGLSLTPLPASVTKIDSKSSDDWQAKVRDYLKKLEDFSKSGI